MSGDAALADGRLYFRQFLSGRDIARTDTFAAQMANYSYALGDREAGTCVLVDPAHAPLELLAAIEADGFSLSGVVLTHFHADHAGGEIADHRIAGVAELLEAAPIEIHLQASDHAYLVRRSTINERFLVDHEDGDHIGVGALDVTLVHTPGHTPGSQCLWTEDLLLTGDTLFLVGCGRTDGPGGDPAELYESLLNRLGTIPDNAVVYPGHAYAREPYALLGEIRRRNPVLVPIPLEEWLRRYS
jgi:glyoxylase-like metal-dependent hydrolase (beta-lactamase superfamily II)